MFRQTKVTFCNHTTISKGLLLTNKHFYDRIRSNGSSFDFVSLENIALLIRKSCFKSSILFLLVLHNLPFVPDMPRSAQSGRRTSFGIRVGLTGS
jgi:hypothetical protein